VSNPRHACQYCDHGTGHAPNCPDAPPVPACPRCAALEAEVRRLREDREEARRERNLEAEFRTAAVRQRDSARALLRDLAAAARAWDETLSEYCDGPERDRLREVLRRAEAGAGGKG
jgi:hypothetical protein